jgi:hypothetical protein
VAYSIVSPTKEITHRQRHSAEESVHWQYFWSICITEKMLLKVILHQQSGAKQYKEEQKIWKDKFSTGQWENTNNLCFNGIETWQY